MYKITIERITKTEYPETDYKTIKDEDGNTVKDEDGYSKKEYFKTGKMLIREDREEIYSQMSEEPLDIKKVIDAFNQ